MIKVVCGIITNDNKILIAQRNKKSSNPLKWELPGGKVEKAETLEAAIKRELKEELNIDIIKLKESKVVNCNISKIKLYAFEISEFTGTIKIKDHIQYSWVERNSLNKYDLTPVDKKLLFD